jgi:hypothetical protein
VSGGCRGKEQGQRYRFYACRGWVGFGVRAKLAV